MRVYGGAGGKGGEVEGRKIRLVIAGDGPARKTLEQFAAANGLPVTFLGNLKNDALPPLYRAADVFIDVVFLFGSSMCWVKAMVSRLCFASEIRSRLV